MLSCLGALALASRGALLESALLFVLSLGLALAARRRPPADASRVSSGSAPAGPAGPMSAAEARRMLGVPPDADRAAIEAAHRRLMARVHPDVGGADGLAAQVNLARETLLKGAP